MFDILIRGGRVVDGTDGPSRVADVAVKDGRIAEVGNLPGTESALTIEAAGKVVAPGFIDIHSHNELYVIRDDYREIFEPYVRQGITTCVVSNCGWSLAPWPREHGDLFRSTLRSMGVSSTFQPEWETQGEFLEWLRRRGLPINFVPLSAHGPVRIAVMGSQARFCTPEELERMKDLVRRDMEAGCRGFSTGLTYFPGMYAHTDELVELARVSREYNGRYVTHVRSLTDTFDRAVEEAVEIARRSGSSLQISHFMCVPNLGRAADLVYEVAGLMERINRIVPLPGIPNRVLLKAYDIVDRALEDGVDVGLDFIPYVMGNTTVTQLYPPWALEGGTDALLRRLSDPVERARIRRDVETVTARWPHWEPGSWASNYIKCLGWKMLSILSVGSEKNRHLEGRRIVDLAREAGKDPFDFLADLTIEEEGSVVFLMGMPPRPWSEKVFLRGQEHPQLSVGADVLFPEKGSPPQTAYGTFPRIIQHYVRELGLYSLENAVHRCTGMAASRYGLEDRGVIKKGSAADLVVFDFQEIRDNSTFDHPRREPSGIEYVIINGKPVLEKGTCHREVLAGQVLTR
ncbi:MAG: D-aminoacylase [Actinomycetota bacterium]|nr:D-aminoacylase [Actinomycetota bacterium]MDI7252978.1 D-aminoacylase [Actinomycetota bacterium]